MVIGRESEAVRMFDSPCEVKAQSGCDDRSYARSLVHPQTQSDFERTLLIKEKGRG
jgi:hypothetical protein